MRRTETSGPIDGYRYRVTMLKASDGLRTSIKLTNVLLPTVGAMLKGDDLDLQRIMDSEIGEAVGASVLDNAITKLSERLDPDVLMGIVTLLAEYTDIVGSGDAGNFADGGAPLSVHFEDHFAGRYTAMIRWLAFALKVNFADFTTGLADLVQEIASGYREKQSAEGNHQSTSNGKSGSSSRQGSQRSKKLKRIGA